MDARVAPRSAIATAVAALGDGSLTAAALAQHVAPLFSRVLARDKARIYLANHSLGRPLDATADDVHEGLAAWYDELGGAWDGWLREIEAFRARLAALLGVARPDSVVPRASAGQGLRAVLNSYDATIRVVATQGEFDSLDVILREYARRRRIVLELVAPRAGGRFDAGDIVRAIGAGCDLLVVSQVMFNTGQRLIDLPDLVVAAHRAGARVLLDVYHALGVLPVDLSALDVDFAVGGSYKYLRGGPGACFLFVHPRLLDEGLRTLDVGWFAKRDRFGYRRPDPPEYGAGGDAWLESTPPALSANQARAGQELTLALDPARLRAYSLVQQAHLVEALASHGIPARGARDDHGAFVVVEDDRAEAWAKQLREAGVVTDARGRYLRLCPDVLTTQDEVTEAAQRLGRVRG